MFFNIPLFDPMLLPPLILDKNENMLFANHLHIELPMLKVDQLDDLSLWGIVDNFGAPTRITVEEYDEAVIKAGVNLGGLLICAKVEISCKMISNFIDNSTFLNLYFILQWFPHCCLFLLEYLGNWYAYLLLLLFAVLVYQFFIRLECLIWIYGFGRVCSHMYVIKIISLDKL